MGCVQSEKLALGGNLFFHPIGLISFCKFYSIEGDQKDASQPFSVRTEMLYTVASGDNRKDCLMAHAIALFSLVVFHRKPLLI